MGQQAVKRHVKLRAWDRKNAQGFTLVETLVAISVLAIVMVVILQLFSGGLKSSTMAERFTRGVFYAKEKMEEILVDDPLIEGIFEGSFDEVFQWKAEIVRVDPFDDEEMKLPFDAFQVTLEVLWEAGGRKKRFQLHTMKVCERSERTG